MLQAHEHHFDHTGDSYLVLDRPLSELVNHIARDLGKQIHCGCAVTHIHHDSTGALLHLYGGRCASDASNSAFTP